MEIFVRNFSTFFKSVALGGGLGFHSIKQNRNAIKVDVAISEQREKEMKEEPRKWLLVRIYVSAHR